MTPITAERTRSVEAPAPTRKYNGFHNGIPTYEFEGRTYVEGYSVPLPTEEDRRRQQEAMDEALARMEEKYGPIDEAEVDRIIRLVESRL